MSERSASLRPRPVADIARSSDEEAGTREFLAFEMGDERYALPLSAVREIVRPPPITEVPRAPREILGIVSVRGHVTTLVDLRCKLGMPPTAIGPRSRVLLADQGREVLGLLVDRVDQVVRLREDEVELSNVLGSDTSSYVMGVGRPGMRIGGSDAAEGEDADILILLDPIALLKQVGR